MTCTDQLPNAASGRPSNYAMQRSALVASVRANLVNARAVRTFLLLANLGLAILAGAYFGLNSCGGMSYERPGHLAIEVTVAALWIAVSAYAFRARSTPWSWRAILPLAIFLPAMHMLFLVTMSAVAPFYPAPPASIDDWWTGFKWSLWAGVPC